MFRTCLLLLAIGLPSIAMAHKPSDSYLRIVAADDLEIRWDIALRDLEVVIGLDADAGGKITWGEVKKQQELIEQIVQTHLKIAADGEPQTIEFDRIEIAQHSDGSYAALMLRIESLSKFSMLTIQYDLLFDVDPTHRGLVSYQGRRGSGTYILAAGNDPLIVHAAGNGWWMPLIDYIGEGIWHIWIGFDHILFLIALMLPSVWRVRKRQHKPAKYVPVTQLAPALREILGIVTFFTIAHSLTLWLVVTQWVVVPSRWVETAIAFSIVVTAVVNLFPAIPRFARSIAFFFGLVHGFGFGGVLTDLGLPTSMLTVSLLGFNIGVELGQLAIVAVLFPLAYRYRSTRQYSRYVFRYGCYAIAAVGTIWMIERALDLTILGL